MWWRWCLESFKLWCSNLLPVMGDAMRCTHLEKVNNSWWVEWLRQTKARDCVSSIDWLSLPIWQITKVMLMQKGGLEFWSVFHISVWYLSLFYCAPLAHQLITIKFFLFTFIISFYLSVICARSYVVQVILYFVYKKKSIFLPAPVKNK